MDLEGVQIATQAVAELSKRVTTNCAPKSFEEQLVRHDPQAHHVLKENFSIGWSP